jgi:O-antigen ligase
MNAILFIRPAEIFPDILAVEQALNVQLYQAAILACLVVSLPVLFEQLSPPALAARPITVCVLGLLVAVPLSHLCYSGNFTDAREKGVVFSKLLLYYLLLVGNLNTPERLKVFLRWLVLFIVGLAALALLQYHGVIQVESLSVLEDTVTDPETGERMTFPRLRSTGIYNDPNDLCLILVTGVLLCLYHLGDRRSSALAPLWLGLFGLFGYAIVLTVSRGGLIGLAAGLVVLIGCRWGWRKAAVLIAVLAPVGAALLVGQQSAAWTGRDTSQSRIQLWSEGLELFREAPLFGIGMGEYADRVELVAHNSFVHCYAELGLFGGTLFLGAFYLALWSLYRLGPQAAQLADRDLGRLQPFVLAIVAACAAGLLSLSRSYIPPTYMYLGLATAYVRLAGEASAAPAVRWDGWLVRRLALVSLAFLAVTYVFVRTFIHRG